MRLTREQIAMVTSRVREAGEERGLARVLAGEIGCCMTTMYGVISDEGIRLRRGGPTGANARDCARRADEADERAGLTAALVARGAAARLRLDAMMQEFSAAQRRCAGHPKLQRAGLAGLITRAHKA